VKKDKLFCPKATKKRNKIYAILIRSNSIEIALIFLESAHWRVIDDKRNKKFREVVCNEGEGRDV